MRRTQILATSSSGQKKRICLSLSWSQLGTSTKWSKIWRRITINLTPNGYNHLHSVSLLVNLRSTTWGAGHQCKLRSSLPPISLNPCQITGLQIQRTAPLLKQTLVNRLPKRLRWMEVVIRKSKNLPKGSNRRTRLKVQHQRIPKWKSPKTAKMIRKRALKKL